MRFHVENVRFQSMSTPLHILQSILDNPETPPNTKRALLRLMPEVKPEPEEVSEDETNDE